MRALLLDVCRGNDFSGQVKPFAEVIETFGGQSVVIVLPGELGLEVTAGGQRLASFNDLYTHISLHSYPARPSIRELTDVHRDFWCRYRHAWEG